MHTFTTYLGIEADHCSICGEGAAHPNHKIEISGNTTDLPKYEIAEPPTALSKAQTTHLERIQYDFQQEVKAKYEKGVKEHGGNLWEKSDLYHIEEAMHEAVDLYVYLHDLRDNIRSKIMMDTSSVATQYISALPFGYVTSVVPPRRK